MIDYGLGVSLRAFNRGDALWVKVWRNDYEVRRWTRQFDLISETDQERWFEKQSLDPTIQMYTVVDDHGGVIGVCGFTGIDLVNRHAEFSLYIAPGARRKGHGKQALQTLLSHGFNVYGLQVIWGETFAHNPAAKMFTAIGCQLEGIRRSFYFREGRFVDAHLYSMLATEWKTHEAFKDAREHK